VIEDQTAVRDRESEEQEADAPTELSVESRQRGFHVRTVPIDQPLGEALILFDGLLGRRLPASESGSLYGDQSGRSDRVNITRERVLRAGTN
jgi:hypothetical protein